MKKAKITISIILISILALVPLAASNSYAYDGELNSYGLRDYTIYAFIPYEWSCEEFGDLDEETQSIEAGDVSDVCIAEFSDGEGDARGWLFTCIDPSYYNDDPLVDEDGFVYTFDSLETENNIAAFLEDHDIANVDSFDIEYKTFGSLDGSSVNPDDEYYALLTSEGDDKLRIYVEYDDTNDLYVQKTLIFRVSDGDDAEMYDEMFRCLDTDLYTARIAEANGGEYTAAESDDYEYDYDDDDDDALSLFVLALGLIPVVISIVKTREKSGSGKKKRSASAVRRAYDAAEKKHAASVSAAKRRPQGMPERGSSEGSVPCMIDGKVHHHSDSASALAPVRHSVREKTFVQSRDEDDISAYRISEKDAHYIESLKVLRKSGLITRSEMKELIEKHSEKY